MHLLAGHSTRRCAPLLAAMQASQVAGMAHTREGTIWPCLIISATMLPSGVPDFMCARNRSPALRCRRPNSSTSLEHCRHASCVRPWLAAGSSPPPAAYATCGERQMQCHAGGDSCLCPLATAWPPQHEDDLQPGFLSMHAAVRQVDRLRKGAGSW